MGDNLARNIATGLMLAVLVAGIALTIYFLWGVLARPGRRKKSLIWMVSTIFVTPIVAMALAVVAPDFRPPTVAEIAAQKAEQAAAEEVAAAAKLAKAKDEAKARAKEIDANRAKGAALRAKEAKCRGDLRCWAEKYSIEAEVYCKPAIERLASYQMKWTDGMLEPKFSRYNWADKKAGTIVYFGDKAMFQNGFGAYQNVIYSCDYDPSSGLVTNASVEPGRL